jgi:hypothetical protein
MFVMTRWALGAQPEIPLSGERFDRLKRAWSVHVATLAIEEKFDLAISNFAEFEQELLSLSVRHLIRRDHQWDQMSTDRLLLNRRLINLLSTCRLYIDQVKHDTGSAELPNGTRELFKRALAKEYDRSLGYRVMEALRNFMQHKSLPVTGISYPIARREKDEKAFFRFGIGLGLSVERLDDDSFKKTGSSGKCVGEISRF